MTSTDSLHITRQHLYLSELSIDYTTSVENRVTSLSTSDTPLKEKDIVKTRDDIFIDSLFNLMTEDNPRNRPKIEDVLTKVKKHLLENHPAYPWASELT